MGRRLVDELPQFEVYCRFLAFRAGEGQELVQLTERFGAVPFGNNDLGTQDVGPESELRIAQRQSNVAALLQQLAGHGEFANVDMDQAFLHQRIAEHQLIAHRPGMLDGLVVVTDAARVIALVKPGIPQGIQRFGHPFFIIQDFTEGQILF